MSEKQRCWLISHDARGRIAVAIEVAVVTDRADFETLVEKTAHDLARRSGLGVRRVDNIASLSAHVITPDRSEAA